MVEPSFHRIPLTLGGGVIVGVVLAKLAGSSLVQWAKVAVIASLADAMLYLGVIEIVNRNTHGLDQKSYRKWTYVCTHTLVSAIEILALRKLELIARNGTILVSCFAITRCVLLSRF